MPPGNLTPGQALTPAQALRRRAAARVLIRGHTRISATLAATLKASGVGQVAVDVAGQATVADSSIGGLTPADSGRPRAAAAADAVLRAAPGAVVGPLPAHRATFVVQVGQEQPARLAALAAARRRVPTLAVDIRDAVAVVGPLVPATGAPCLNCLDLHRRDHDQAWPQLAAQLVSAPETPLACTVATALAATAYAAHQVLAWLDGRPTETLGATVEISTPGRHRRRTWPPHRGCDCSQAGRRQHQRDG
jgi:hypothetical protein